MSSPHYPGDPEPTHGSSPHDSGDRSPRDSGDDPEAAGGIPYRAIALVLLTLVVIALGVGIVQLFSNGDSSDSETSAAPSSAASAPASQGAPAAAPSSAPAGNDENGEIAAPEGAPGAATPAPNGESAAPAAPSGAQQAVPVRVYNNSTVPGLADDVAASLRGKGVDVSEVGNYSQGNVPTSGVYYGTDPAEQAEAERIAGDLGIEARPRFEGLDAAHPGVIVIVTQDMQGL